MMNIKIYIISMIILMAFTTKLNSRTLRIFTWEGYAPANEVKGFEAYILKKYNKKVKIDVKYIFSPNDFFDRLRAKEADLITPVHNLIKDINFNFIKNRLILPLDMENIPNHKKIIKSYQNLHYFQDKDKIYAIPITHGLYALAYNASLINEPESWNILWSKDLKFNYSISGNYYEANIYITAFALGYEKRDITLFEKIDNHKFQNKLRSLAHNSRCMWTGVDKADDISGMKAAAVWGFSIPELKKRGENWKIAHPQEGNIAWIDSMAIGYSLKNKPFLKKVAEEWINHMISKEFQLYLTAKKTAYLPVNSEAVSELTQEEKESYHIEHFNGYHKKNFVWPVVDSHRDRNGMKFLWDEAVKGLDKPCGDS